jgi:ABC-type thiamine transport system substrate-binding protein
LYASQRNEPRSVHCTFQLLWDINDEFSASRRTAPYHICSVLVFSVSLPAFAQETLTLYTTREPGLIQPLLDSWTKTSGIKVSTVYIKDGMLERVKAEGKNSPADLLMTVDAGNLIDLVEAGVTQPVESEALKTAIPVICAAQIISGLRCRCVPRAVCREVTANR